MLPCSPKAILRDKRYHTKEHEWVNLVILAISSVSVNFHAWIISIKAHRIWNKSFSFQRYTIQVLCSTASRSPHETIPDIQGGFGCLRFKEMKRIRALNWVKPAQVLICCFITGGVWVIHKKRRKSIWNLCFQEFPSVWGLMCCVLRKRRRWKKVCL